MKRDSTLEAGPLTCVGRLGDILQRAQVHVHQVSPVPWWGRLGSQAVAHLLLGQALPYLLVKRGCGVSGVCGGGWGRESGAREGGAPPPPQPSRGKWILRNGPNGRTLRPFGPFPDTHPPTRVDGGQGVIVIETGEIVD